MFITFYPQKLSNKAALPLQLPSKYSFYTLHREKKGAHLESEHHYSFLQCYVLPLCDLDMFIADVEFHILDETLDVLLVAHRANHQHVGRVDNDIILQSTYHCNFFFWYGNQ